MGEQDNTGDSISYLVPKVQSPVSGWPVGSLGDYFGLPAVGQVTSGFTVTHSALPLRAYNLIYNEWFRDENLQNSVPENKADGPDAHTDYVLLRRGKRHDYFTSALPWPQKGDECFYSVGYFCAGPDLFESNGLWGATGVNVARCWRRYSGRSNADGLSRWCDGCDD